jgi:hypothetical protein
VRQIRATSELRLLAEQMGRSLLEWLRNHPNVSAAERRNPSERIFFEILLFAYFPGVNAMTDAGDAVSPAVTDLPAATFPMRNEQRPQRAVFCHFYLGM